MWSNRPLGHVKQITHKRGSLQIEIEYFWVRMPVNGTTPESVSLLSHQCRAEQSILCKWREAEKRKGANNLTCNRDICDNCSEITSALKLLAHRLKGLRARLLLANTKEQIVLG
ncbi:MAG: hypothetical protein JXA73_11720 [Acidobacteria bacterium]|nr:hypothetical protein [Acidobacteriota bacterium]